MGGDHLRRLAFHAHRDPRARACTYEPNTFCTYANELLARRLGNICFAKNECVTASTTRVVSRRASNQLSTRARARPMPSSPRKEWTVPQIRELVFRKFGKRPCLWQIKVARALREKRSDVVAIAATGSGKTLSFWIALLMALEDGEDKLVIVVTPLNLLGQQNADDLGKAGIGSVAVESKNASESTFNVCTTCQWLSMYYLQLIQ